MRLYSDFQVGIHKFFYVTSLELSTELWKTFEDILYEKYEVKQISLLKTVHCFHLAYTKMLTQFYKAFTAMFMIQSTNIKLFIVVWRKINFLPK